jgi:hypothetical protein
MPKGLAGDGIEGEVEFHGGGHGRPAARVQAWCKRERLMPLYRRRLPGHGPHGRGAGRALAADQLQARSSRRVGRGARHATPRAPRHLGVGAASGMGRSEGATWPREGARGGAGR